MGSTGAARTLRPRRWALAAALATAAGLAAWAAVTEPFSAPADAVTAAGIGLVVATGVARWRVRPPAPAPADQRDRWWPWLALVAVAVAWELVSFFLAPRVDHPTISSLYDSATRWQAVKGPLFFAWLAVGAWLVRW